MRHGPLPPLECLSGPTGMVNLVAKLLTEQFPIGSRTRGKEPLLIHGPGDILLMRLASTRDVSTFLFPVFARADSPAFESRDERARLRTT